MQQTFPLTPGQLYEYVQHTVRGLSEYRFGQKEVSQEEFKIYYPEKAIILQARIIQKDDRAELYLDAMSPICVISDNYALTFIHAFLSQLKNNITGKQDIKRAFYPATDFHQVRRADL